MEYISLSSCILHRRVVRSSAFENQRSDYVTRRFAGSTRKSGRISGTFTQTNLVSLTPSFLASSALRVNFARGRHRLTIHYIQSPRCMQTVAVCGTCYREAAGDTCIYTSTYRHEITSL